MSETRETPDVKEWAQEIRRQQHHARGGYGSETLEAILAALIREVRKRDAGVARAHHCQNVEGSFRWACIAVAAAIRARAKEGK